MAERRDGRATGGIGSSAGRLEGAAPELDDTTRDFLKALASPGRQQVMLLFAGGAELSVSEVADRAGIGQSTASQQLSLLKRGRILTSRREGKTVYYRSDTDGSAESLAKLRDYLASCC